MLSKEEIRIRNLACCKRYRERNKVKNAAVKKLYDDSHKEQRRKYYLAHKKEKASYTKKYISEHREHLNEIERLRRKQPLVKLSINLRSRLNIGLQKKGWRKISKFSEYAGCTLEELKAHLEKQFLPGMTWNNHSRKGWHIDHIIPLDSAQTVEEMIKLCRYTNLQPLWAKDNLSKGSKI